MSALSLSTAVGGTHTDLASPFRLNIYNPKVPNFAAESLTASGDVTAMAKNASLFEICSYGGLSTADKGQVTTYLSTSGKVKSVSWTMGPSLSTIYFGLSLRTTRHGEILTRRDKAFDRGRARFCQQGSMVVIVFKGSVPGNCTLIDLLAYMDK